MTTDLLRLTAPGWGIAAVLAACLSVPLSEPLAAQQATQGAAPPNQTPTQGRVPLDAAAFDAYVTGKTITYHQFGQAYGVEEYLPDRRVRWAFTDTECQYGHWYQQDDHICFVYEYDPAPQCWIFWMDGRGLNGLYDGNPEGSELTEVSRSTDPLPCPGPDVGV